MHEDFLFDHVRALAAEHVHTEGDFDFPEVQLDAPALKVKLSQGIDGIGACVEQRGDEPDGLGAVAACAHAQAHMAQSQGIGELGEIVFRNAFGAFGWLGPGDEALVGAEPGALAKVGLSGPEQNWTGDGTKLDSEGK